MNRRDPCIQPTISWLSPVDVARKCGHEIGAPEQEYTLVPVTFPLITYGTFRRGAAPRRLADAKTRYAARERERDRERERERERET
jgi:hypothetical protein